jgi:RNA polymerase sigma factor (sigma-70 family)
MAKAKIPTVSPDCWDCLKKGDPAALGELYDAYVDRLFLVASGFTDQRELAKDALQEVFVELWHYRETLGDIQYPLAYLTKVLRSILIKKLKKEAPIRHYSVEEIPLHQETSHEDNLMTADADHEITLRLNQAMAQLTTRQKLILRLHYYEGLSYEQIAEKLSMNYQSVNNLAFRTIRHLRSIMCMLF